MKSGSGSSWTSLRLSAVRCDMKISPSIASADPLCLGHELKRLGSDYATLHVDIEDGNFVPNLTFGLKTVRALRTVTDKPFSVHLMVTCPETYIEELAGLNCEVIFVHAEVSLYLQRLLKQIHSHSIRAGLALNPISDIQQYEYLIDKADAVLYMSSEPDGEGDQFLPGVLGKIRRYPGVENWIDGGVSQSQLKSVAEAGIDHVVMGREIFGSPNPEVVLAAVQSRL